MNLCKTTTKKTPAHINAKFAPKYAPKILNTLQYEYGFIFTFFKGTVYTELMSPAVLECKGCTDK